MVFHGQRGAPPLGIFKYTPTVDQGDVLVVYTPDPGSRGRASTERTTNTKVFQHIHISRD